MMLDYEVAIIGAGPAGCACALALLRAGGPAPLLLEAGRAEATVAVGAPNPAPFRIGESVPPELLPLLRHLGVAERFAAAGHAPCYGSCSWWGSEQRGFNDYVMNPLGCGHHLDRVRFDADLRLAAADAGAHVIYGCKIMRAVARENGYHLQAADGRSFTARTVVDASGANTRFGTRQLDDELICLARRHSPGGGEYAAMTHLEACPAGWWYGITLPSGEMLTALFTDAATLKQARSQAKAQAEAQAGGPSAWPVIWADWLQAAPHTARRLAHASALPMNADTHAFAVPSALINAHFKQRWWAVGDAAAVWDPLTAQGITKAIADGIATAGALCRDHTPGARADTHGAYLALRRDFYAREQRFATQSFWHNRHTRTAQACLAHASGSALDQE